MEKRKEKGPEAMDDFWVFLGLSQNSNWLSQFMWESDNIALNSPLLCPLFFSIHSLFPPRLYVKTFKTMRLWHAIFPIKAINSDYC